MLLLRKACSRDSSRRSKLANFIVVQLVHCWLLQIERSGILNWTKQRQNANDCYARVFESLKLRSYTKLCYTGARVYNHFQCYPHTIEDYLAHFKSLPSAEIFKVVPLVIAIKFVDCEKLRSVSFGLLGTQTCISTRTT